MFGRVKYDFKFIDDNGNEVNSINELKGQTIANNAKITFTSSDESGKVVKLNARSSIIYRLKTQYDFIELLNRAVELDEAYASDDEYVKILGELVDGKQTITLIFDTQSTSVDLVFRYINPNTNLQRELDYTYNYVFADGILSGLYSLIENTSNKNLFKGFNFGGFEVLDHSNNSKNKILTIENIGGYKLIVRDLSKNETEDNYKKEYKTLSEVKVFFEENNVFQEKWNAKKVSVSFNEKTVSMPNGADIVLDGLTSVEIDFNNILTFNNIDTLENSTNINLNFNNVNIKISNKFLGETKVVAYKLAGFRFNDKKYGLGENITINGAGVVSSADGLKATIDLVWEKQYTVLFIDGEASSTESKLCPVDNGEVTTSNPVKDSNYVENISIVSIMSIGDLSRFN